MGPVVIDGGSEVDDNTDKFLRRLRRLRIIFALLFAWFIMFSILPDAILGVLGQRGFPAKLAFDVVTTIVITCAALAILFEIRTLASVLRPALLGIALLVLSGFARLYEALDIFQTHTPFMRQFFHSVLNRALSDTGIALTVWGFFYAIVELLRTRREIALEMAERKRAEEAVRASEANYRELVQGANSIILRMDAQGRVTFANQFAQQFFGYAQEQMLGRHVVGLIVPERDSDGHDLSETIQNLYRRPESFATHENENMRANGDRVWIAWTNRPLYDVQGAVAEILCIGNDVTARRKAEQALAEQRRKIAEVSRLTSLGVMAGSLAHEVNNPLAIIALAGEQLERIQLQPELNREQLHLCVERINRHTSRIERIIRSLRTLSQDGSQETLRPMALQTIITDVLEVCQVRFAGKNIILQPPPESMAVEIECRPTEIAQVLLNLLNNAYDAIEAHDQKWIRLEIDNRQDDITLSVIDSGPGVPNEIRSRLMDPFFTTKEPGKGTGLGLSISKRIIESHGGRLLLQTGHPGACFTIHLPKRQPAPKPPGKTPPLQ